MSTLLLTVGLALAMVVLFAAATWLQRGFGLSHEASRKVVHVASALVAATMPFIVADRSILITASAILLVALPLGGWLGWFPGVVRAGRTSTGPLCFLAAYLVLLVVEQSRAHIAVAFALVGVADAAACGVGMTFGRHRFVGSTRTWEGSAAFFVVALVTLVGAGPLLGLSPLTTVTLALSGALVTTALEAIAPSALDNLLVPLATAAMCALASRWDHARAAFHLIEIAGSVGIVVVALRLGWLNDRGGLATLAVGVLILAASDWRPVTVLLAFFVASSVLTKLAPRRAVQQDHVRGRTHRQVIALGVVPTACALALALGGPAWLAGALIAAVAAAAADTWATEIGRLSRAQPRLITTFARVPAGTSGGVTVLGLAAALGGASAIATLGAALAIVPHTAAPVIAVAGFAASLFDSLLGALAQAKFRCGACTLVVETRSCCAGADVVLVGGVRPLENEAVNFLMSAGAALAFVAWALVGGLA